MDITSTLDCCSWASVKKIVTCTVCKDIFKKPCTLICCHTFCHSCIKSIKVCPTCQPNDFFSFKLLHFENYFLARLTKVFIHQQNINASCINCLHDTKMCKHCCIIGCIKCNSQKVCSDDSKEHFLVSVDLSKPPEELLHLFSGTGNCEQHKTMPLTNYCYTCERMRCSDCLQSCTNHKISKKIDKPNESNESDESIPKLISALNKVKEEIINQEHAFVQHRENLDEMFKEDFDKAAQWFDHAYNCLCHEKQNTVFRLKVFQCSLNMKIETFLSHLEFLAKLTNDFQTYFNLLLHKSSDSERHQYKEKTLQITYREKELKNTILKIANQFENKFSRKKVFEKFFTLTHTCEGISRCDTKCKKVDDLRSHLNTDQKYKLEVISYCQARNSHDKLKVDQVTVKGSCYSMFSLPLASSKVVRFVKQSHTLDISKCASCVSQLKLYTKTIVHQDVETELKDKGNKVCEMIVISSIRTLLQVSNNSISSIERAILHLHKDNVSMYFKEIEENVSEFENFAKRMDEYRLSLQRISSELELFQTRHMCQQPNKIYSNMLIDIIFDCETYISKVYEAVKKITCIKEKIKLLYNEDDVCTDNIINEGFQVEIVSYYSTCVALNEICKSSVELIDNWIK